MIIATDLDRTLLPNGSQEYDGSMELFRKIISQNSLRLVFVTGRHIGLVKEAIDEHSAPSPDFVISDVGTRIYEGVEKEDLRWQKVISAHTKGWDLKEFRESLDPLPLRLQEEDKLNDFKLSYYIDDVSAKDSESMVKETEIIIREICHDATVVYSVDETNDIGLIDVLPRKATKLAALEYLRNRMNAETEDIVYCGDSGNDILPLTHGYKAILVRNAIPSVKAAVKELSIQKNIIDRLCVARGLDKLNGYYVSGIIEGLIRHGLIDAKYSQ